MNWLRILLKAKLMQPAQVRWSILEDIYVE
jgi:hypothetical protein